MNYEVKCLACGTEVGEILFGTFFNHPGCTTALPRKFGMLRCCHCGGSLYLDPADSRQAPVNLAHLRTLVAEAPVVGADSAPAHPCRRRTHHSRTRMA